MSHTLLATLGITSGVLNLGGMIPYFWDILHRKTKPERATWWIWLGLSIIAFSAQWAAGATWSLFLTGAQLASVWLVAVLSIRYGYGTFHRRDLISILLAMAGLVLWKFTNEPLLALLIVVIVDFLGFWLTVHKTWLAPHSETLSTWALATISGLSAAAAVGELSFTKLLYPVYIMLGNGLLVFVIITRRSIVKRPEAA